MRFLIVSFFVLIPLFLFAGKFEEEIVPLLKNSCLKCHGGEKTKGKVDFSAILTERDAGDHLDLWETVIEVVELGEMPPEEEKPLSTDERAKIRTWRDEFMRLPTVSSIPVFRPRRLSALSLIHISEPTRPY